MKVGWLVHDPGYIGGAEMTQAEFKAAAPDGVEVVEMGPGEVGPADRYVAQNIPFHTLEDLNATGDKPLWKYIHDAWPFTQPGVREHVLDRAGLIFCSKLHRAKFPYPIPEHTPYLTIPPPVDLDAFRPTRQVRRNGKREGACSIAQWRNPGKGARQLAEWAAVNGPVDVYGPGECIPHGLNLTPSGSLEPAQVPQTLWRYESFVFLPFDFEPFCRSVVEAQAAGCRIIGNNLIGAAEYLDNPEAITTAASDFWEAVTA